MSGRCYTGHARERLLERYGLRLQDCEFEIILEQCTSGHAPCMATSETGRTFVVPWCSHRLIVTLAATDDLIVTFQPPNYFVAGQGLLNRQRKGRAKQRGPAAQFARLDGYNRAAWKREAREMDAE